MKAHHRNMAFRPPRKVLEDEAGGFNLLTRFHRRYLWPHRWPVLMCILLLSASACSPYLMAYYTRIVLDRVLLVGKDEPAAAVPAHGRAELSAAGRDHRAPGYVRERAVVGRRFEPGADVPMRPPGAGHTLLMVFLAYIGTIVALNLVSRLMQRTRIRIGQRITAGLREDMHKKVLELSLSYHKAHSPGRLLARILSDVGVVQEQMIATILDVTSNVVMIGVGVVILFSVEWRMALIALGVLPFYVLLYGRAQSRIREINKEIRHTNSCMYGLASQKLEGMKAIQAYGRERHEYLNFHRLSACLLRDSVFQQLLGAGLGRAAAITAALGTGIIFLYGVHRVLAGTMTFGAMMYAYGAASSLFGPVQTLSQVSVTVTRLLVILQRLVRVMDEPVEIADAPDAVDFPIPLVSGIDIQHVHFRYAPATPPVLEDLLLKIEAGTWLCIMGASGSGKTTLLYLLSRLYQPQTGEIRVDDIPLDKIRMNALRQRMALVPQEPQIFSGTVRDNICYGYPDAQPSEIMAAAKAAEMHDLIMAMPVKYETILGERGTTLSGGQRQRLSLARALLTNPDILLLDDCTSALDAETEQRIQDTLTRVLPGRTAVIVSQRVSMARRCHRICVLSNGVISECGTHEELIRQKGFYARLHTQQTGGAPPR